MNVECYINDEKCWINDEMMFNKLCDIIELFMEKII